MNYFFNWCKMIINTFGTGEKIMTLDDAKILISDDSILARKQLKDIISRYGNPTFLEATNGQDTIDI